MHLTSGRAQLNQTQSVATNLQPHGFGINGNAGHLFPLRQNFGGQVIVV
jgi:hypothetical protein